MGEVRMASGVARRRTVSAVALLALLLAVGWTASASAKAHRHSRRHAVDYRQNCPEPFPAHRDSSNPLDLTTPPGPDPLTGASFFVPGPAR
ncbi:MAG: hypothetical protein ACRDL8_13335 [Solirubrobacteraceae bacterium]